jgi:chaperonin GroEL
MAGAVKVTMGPRGRTVGLERKYGLPVLVDDGVTVARDIELPNPFENLGARLLREAATKTEDVAGDGTTTATVLAQAVVNWGFRNIAAGADPMAMKRGLDRATKTVIDAVKACAIPVTGRTEIAQVATISSHDPEIGALIADVFDRVGKDGVVTVEESQSLAYETDYVEGMQFDRGYLSPYFVTNPDRMEATLEEPAILIADRRISAVADLLPILEQLVKASKKDLLVVAEDVDGEALGTLVVNRLRGILNVVAVKAPGFGERRKEMLGDLAVMTGGTVISEEAGRRLDQAALADLGHARRATATKDETTIIEGRGDRAAIDGRIRQLRAQIEETTSDYDREKLQERVARLAGGVAVVRVGAASEVELKEKKHRVEDAVSSTRSAIEEGIVPGGGVILLRAAAALDGLHLEGDEGLGVTCLRRALEEPLRQIVTNAGFDGGVVLEAVRRRQAESGNPNLGFDAEAGEYVDLIQRGVIDPVKVTRTAIENAVSVASMVLTTEALVVDKPEPERALAMEGGGMDEF